MGTIIIYHDGVQEEVDEELVKIYQPFEDKEEKKNEKVLSETT